MRHEPRTQLPHAPANDAASMDQRPILAGGETTTHAEDDRSQLTPERAELQQTCMASSVCIILLALRLDIVEPCGSSCKAVTFTLEKDSKLFREHLPPSEAATSGPDKRRTTTCPVPGGRMADLERGPHSGTSSPPGCRCQPRRQSPTTQASR